MDEQRRKVIIYFGKKVFFQDKWGFSKGVKNGKKKLKVEETYKRGAEKTRDNNLL